MGYESKIRQLDINNQFKNQSFDYESKIKELYNCLNMQSLDYKNKIQELNNIINNVNKQFDHEKKIKELNDIINDKNNELNKLRSECNNNIIREILPGEEIISVLFISGDYKLTYSLPCKNTTVFVKIEEKLYEEFPEYRETDNYFLVGGIKVKRFKTIKENAIKNGKPVMFIQGE